MVIAKHVTIKTAEKYGLSLETQAEWMRDFEWTMIHRSCQADATGIVKIYTDSDLNKTTFYAVTIKCECGEKFGDIVGTEIDNICECSHCHTEYKKEDINLDINPKLLAKVN